MGAQYSFFGGPMNLAGGGVSTHAGHHRARRAGGPEESSSWRADVRERARQPGGRGVQCELGEGQQAPEAQRGVTLHRMMLDLDKIQGVNDTVGHSWPGDQIGWSRWGVAGNPPLGTPLGWRGWRSFDELRPPGGRPKIRRRGAIALRVRIIKSILQPFDLNGQEGGVRHQHRHCGLAAGGMGVEAEELREERRPCALRRPKPMSESDFLASNHRPMLENCPLTSNPLEIELADAIPGGKNLKLHKPGPPVVDVKKQAGFAAVEAG